MKSIFLGDKNLILRVYPQSVIDKLNKQAGLLEGVYTANDLKALPPDADCIFSTWEIPCLEEAQIKSCLPNVKAVFYAAGSVQHFARPFLNCGARVFSAWAANAVPVAEFAAAQIILANKNYFCTSRHYSSQNQADNNNARASITGNYNSNTGIIGVGMIGTLTIEKLKAITDLNILVFDPFLSDAKAAQLNVKKASLDEIFSTCRVVSNHLADNAQTRGIFDYKLFSKMPPYPTFINTGRGAQVVEADLIRFLNERADATALLDVTYPEPPISDSMLYRLPNAVLSPHIAGSLGAEVNRMAEYMLDEFMRFSTGLPAMFEVTRSMLDTMA